MAENLAPVYLDDSRIRLQGDPRPQVRRILEAGGKRPDNSRVMRLRSRQDRDGSVVKLDDVIDRRANADEAVYLKVERDEDMQPGAADKEGGGQESQDARRAAGGDEFARPSEGTPIAGEPLGERFGGDRIGGGSNRGTEGGSSYDADREGGNRQEDRETGQANVPQGYGGLGQQGVQRSGGGGGDAREFGADESGTSPGREGGGSRGLGEREGGQPITGMGMEQQSGKPRMASEQREWKAGVPGTGSTAGARVGQGGADDSSGAYERQFSGGKADIRTQQGGNEGGAADTLDSTETGGRTQAAAGRGDKEKSGKDTSGTPKE